jgi:16S rRNA (guanine966-N2)-methyltransferase
MPDAGRVIAGSARGIRLAAPPSGTRPLGDRVKQTLFAILEPDLGGSRFLDLFAGSGAAGIEALSRGARDATFVERDGAAVRTIEANVRAAHVDGERVRIARADAIGWLASAAGVGAPFDVVFLDPPYADDELLRRALDRLGRAGHAVVVPNGRVIAKHFWRTVPPARIGLLASERERRFGETTLTFYRRLDAPQTHERRSEGQG